jgi:GntR family transcriptional regulator/MocR family aminotransferase
MLPELDGRGPLYQQLSRALQGAVEAGRLQTGARLPSTRELAEALDVSRNTVRAAYDDLVASGVIASRHGSGAYALPTEPAPRGSRETARIPPTSRYSERTRAIHDYGAPRLHHGLRFNLQYGEALADTLLPDTWRRELARAAAYTSLGYPPMQGLPELRLEVARWLRERRGIHADPEDIVIVSGTQQALSLAARVLLDEGDSAVIEDPGYFGARWALQAHGARLVAVPVDRSGLMTEHLPNTRPGLIVVTPTHQFPLGVTLAAQRRSELLCYARRQDSWIVEDDYDGELSYDGPPVAPLRAIPEGSERVIHVGSFSKLIAPSLRLAYLVAPRALRSDFVSAKLLCDLGCSAIEQAALAGFMRSGAFARHLRRVVRALRARREALTAGLARHAAPHLTVDKPGSGMHLVAWTEPGSRLHVPSLIRLAAAAGVGLHPVMPHYVAHRAPPGLLLGYAGLSAAEIRAACRVLGPCIEQALLGGEGSAR